MPSVSVPGVDHTRVVLFSAFFEAFWRLAVLEAQSVRAHVHFFKGLRDLETDLAKIDAGIAVF